MQKAKIAVIGANSMVGSRFCELSRENFKLIKADLSGIIKVDVTKKESVAGFFKNHSFDFLILFSAYTDVDGAEKQRDDKNGSCWQINVEATKNIVESAQKFKKTLIYISTDFVFEGDNGPYGEDTNSPQNQNKLSWYGITKSEGEKIVKNNLSQFIILRITYPYRGRFEKKEDIAKRILRLYLEDNLYPLFDDQFTTPTFIDDVAPSIKLLITKGKKGIFHLASPKVVSQYEFGKEIIRVFGGKPADVKRGSLMQYLKKSKATPRPIKGGLKIDKIKSLGFMPTDWREGIKKIYEQSEGKLL